MLVLAAPDQGPAFSVFLCQQYKLSSSCNTTYGATTYGSVLTQVFANADVSGYDGKVGACFYLRCFTGALTYSCPLCFLSDDMPGYLVELVPAPTDAPAEPHRLVRETKAKSATTAQDTKW